ncbi:MAG: HD domain-containing protein [Anaerolineales bacterium]|nr:HD domain-containing protein [Anaerolineales bacterium]
MFLYEARQNNSVQHALQSFLLSALFDPPHLRMANMDSNSDVLDSISDSIIIKYPRLTNHLQQLTRQVGEIFDSFMKGWIIALEIRDFETREHTERVTNLTLQLAHHMGLNGESHNYIRWGALLHDIGKIGVPDAILLKPGPLTKEEWDVMRQHPVYAYQMLVDVTFIGPAIEIPYLHHEKWDGTGYPLGLKGEDIPLSARIFAIVDVWDALCSKRPYRDAWEREQILDHIRKGSGKHFDPKVVEAFMELITGYD